MSTARWLAGWLSYEQPPEPPPACARTSLLSNMVNMVHKFLGELDMGSSDAPRKMVSLSLALSRRWQHASPPPSCAAAPASRAPASF